MSLEQFYSENKMRVIALHGEYAFEGNCSQVLEQQEVLQSYLNSDVKNIL